MQRLQGGIGVVEVLHPSLEVGCLQEDVAVAPLLPLKHEGGEVLLLDLTEYARDFVLEVLLAMLLESE